MLCWALVNTWTLCTEDGEECLTRGESLVGGLLPSRVLSRGLDLEGETSLSGGERSSSLPLALACASTSGDTCKERRWVKSRGRVLR